MVVSYKFRDIYYLNAGPSTISCIFKELNLKKKNIDYEVTKLYRNGLIQAEIARQLNVRRSTIGGSVENRTRVHISFLLSFYKFSLFF